MVSVQKGKNCDCAVFFISYIRDDARTTNAIRQALRADAFNTIIESIQIPSPFKSIQAADLSSWDEKENHREFVKLSRSRKQYVCKIKEAEMAFFQLYSDYRYTSFHSGSIGWRAVVI